MVSWETQAKRGGDCSLQLCLTQTAPGPAPEAEADRIAEAVAVAVAAAAGAGRGRGAKRQGEEGAESPECTRNASSRTMHVVNNGSSSSLEAGMAPTIACDRG